jgi:hypothetical protein
MSRRITSNLAFPALVLTIGLGAPCEDQAQQSSSPYPTMAPLAKYLDADTNAEISLARSAAPAAISRDATILVLKQHGYETAEKGKNHFVCVVERSWMSPFDSPEFWNPKNRSPTCFNPAAVRSVLPFTIKRTEMVLAGLSETQIVTHLREAIENKQMPALEPGAMCYMMSRQAYFGDTQGHWHPHLMFYGPRSDGADWGANLPDSPVLLGPQFENSPEPFSIFMVPVHIWSDGTPDEAHKH